MRWAGHVQSIRQIVKKSIESRREWQKKKRKTKAVSNEILKGQVRTAKSGRPQKTEGNGEH